MSYSKYGNQPVRVDGRRFASKAEARRYIQLKKLEKQGAIAHLVCQPRYPLDDGKGAPVYIGDFRYSIGERIIVEDIKGVETPVFRIKAWFFRKRYPNIELRVLKV